MSNVQALKRPSKKINNDGYTPSGAFAVSFREDNMVEIWPQPMRNLGRL